MLIITEWFEILGSALPGRGAERCPSDTWGGISLLIVGKEAKESVSETSRRFLRSIPTFIFPAHCVLMEP